MPSGQRYSPEHIERNGRNNACKDHIERTSPVTKLVGSPAADQTAQHAAG
jgi:hypothetical protein